MTLAEDAHRLNLRARRAHQLRARHDRQRTAGPRRSRGSLPALILLTDERRLADPSPAVARLPRGSAVILRHYGLSDTDRAALARKLRAVTRARGILLLIAATGGAPNDLARAVRADGIHLAEWCVRQGTWRARGGRKPGALVTASAHSWPAVRRARARGVDAVLLSPVFATASHAGGRPLGALRFAAWARQSPIPVYALGGIDVRSAARLRQTRACGLAGIGGLIIESGIGGLIGESGIGGLAAPVDRNPRRG